jgi:hypothetical protein
VATAPIGPAQLIPGASSSSEGPIRVEEHHIYDSEDQHFDGGWVFKIEAVEDSEHRISEEIARDENPPELVGSDDDEDPFYQWQRQEQPTPGLPPVPEPQGDAQMVRQIREGEYKKPAILLGSGSHAHCAPSSFSPNTRVSPGGVQLRDAQGNVISGGGVQEVGLHVDGG